MPNCDHCGDDVTGKHTVTYPAEQVRPYDGDRTLCADCDEGFVPVLGDPRHHQWTPVNAAIEGRGSMATYVVERCTICGDLRIDESAEVIERV